MTPAFHICMLAIISVESLIDILASVFIVALILLEQAKGRRLKSCDLILVALGISWTSFQCTLVGDTLLSVVWLELYNLDYVYPVLIQLELFTGMACSWLTAYLCVFYCVKIVDITHRLFIWLKLRISAASPWLLLVLVVWSLVSSIPVYWNSYRDLPQNTTSLATNSSAKSGDLKWRPWYKAFNNALGFFLPLLFSMASITLIFTSLCRHTQRMKAKASEFSQPRLVAHFGAAKMVGSLFLIFIIMFLAMVLQLSYPSFQLNLVFKSIMNASALAHPIILIFGNAKLKMALLKILAIGRK